jgi:hypothetical protein
MRHFDRIFQLLHNAPDDGGGGETAWPDYQVPAGVGAGGDDSQDDTAGPTSSGDSDAPGRESQGEASYDGAAPPQRQGNAPANTRPPLPPGRVEETTARADARYADLEARFKANEALLDKLKGVFGPDKPAADPRAAAVRNRLLEVMPELKEVLELAGMRTDLQGLLQRAPGFVAQEQRMWGDLAARTMGKVHESIAPFMLGDGADAAALTKDQKEYLAGELQRYCLRDPKRVERYEQADPTLIEEFRDYYAAVHVAPARRSMLTNATRRAAAGGQAPRAGRADAAGSTIPKADPTDDDAVHNKAWTHLSSAFAGRR